MKSVTATQFKAKCLWLIGQMSQDREPVTITKRGLPVAVLSPLPDAGQTASIVGAMEGVVLRYDDPFRPAADPSDWDASR